MYYLDVVKRVLSQVRGKVRMDNGHFEHQSGKFTWQTRRHHFHNIKSSLNSGQQWYFCTKPFQRRLSSPPTNWLQSSHSEVDVTGSDAPRAFLWCLDLYEIWCFHPSHISTFTWIVFMMHLRLPPFQSFQLPPLSRYSHYSSSFLMMTLWKGLIQHIWEFESLMGIVLVNTIA